MNINDFIYPEQFLPRPITPIAPPVPIEPGFTVNQNEEIIDLKYIIENKPPTKEVREFMRVNLASIISDEDSLFNPVEQDKKVKK